MAIICHSHSRLGSYQGNNNEQKTTLQESQSIYIPEKALHRLSNYEDMPLTIIEVQRGSYLGEDDIVRYDDKYGRING